MKRSTPPPESRKPIRRRQGLRLELQNAGTRTRLPPVAQMRDWLTVALRDRRETAEIVVRIVDETESAALNRAYRGKNAPTNVLSFPFEAPPVSACAHLGDLVVCAPVIEREALEQGKALEAHWAHMLVHGALHLLGYDHGNDAEAAIMEGLETDIMQSLGYPDPYEGLQL